LFISYRLLSASYPSRYTIFLFVFGCPRYPTFLASTPTRPYGRFPYSSIGAPSPSVNAAMQNQTKVPFTLLSTHPCIRHFRLCHHRAYYASSFAVSLLYINLPLLPSRCPPSPPTPRSLARRPCHCHVHLGALLLRTHQQRLGGFHEYDSYTLLHPSWKFLEGYAPREWADFCRSLEDIYTSSAKQRPRAKPKLVLILVEGPHGQR
jgi:hypothetical protein